MKCILSRLQVSSASRLTEDCYFIYIYTHNVNISKVEYNLNGSMSLCSERSLYIAQAVSSYCSAPRILSETKHTLEELKWSSNKYMLQTLKTKPRAGLAFLLRNELNVDVLQEIYDAHQLFKHFWRRGRITSGCLQIWGLFANIILTVW